MARAIKISSVSGALTVTITGPNGGTPTVYADSQLANTLSMPATIADTATTSFWLPGPGKYTLSVKTSGGTEIAADNNSTRTVDLETDSSVAALNYDARTLATVSGDSGHSTAGSAASLPTQTSHGGQFLQTDGSNAAWAAASTFRKQAIDVTQAPYSAVADGVTGTDGVTTAANATFTSAGATFTVADVGKSMFVENAGSATVPALRTISAFVDAHTVTLSSNLNVTGTAKRFVYGTDNTAAIQAAIAAANTAAGGTIYFPRPSTAGRQYLVTGNLSIPNIVTASGSQAIGYEFIGDEAPSSWVSAPGSGVGSTYDLGPQKSGSIVRFVAVAGTAGLYAAGPSQSNIQVYLRNLCFRSYDNPAITCVDMAQANALSLENFVVDTGLNTGSTSQPTNLGFFGIKFPAVNNIGPNKGFNFAVEGYDIGVQISEHCSLDEWLTQKCNIGLGVDNGFHASDLGHWLSAWCPTTMKALAGSAPALKVSTLNLEETSGGTWTDPVFHVDDASNVLRFTGTVHRVTASVGVNTANIRLNGAANVDLRNSQFAPQTVSSSGAQVVLVDTHMSDRHRVTLNASVQIVLPTPRLGKDVIVDLVQDATGSRTVTWLNPGGTVAWAAGTPPTLTVTAAARDRFRFTCQNGTDWSGVTLALNDKATTTQPAGALAVQFDASTLGLADGTAVSSFTDSSGQGFHATQGTGINQPTFHTAVQNGLGAVQFAGSHWLDTVALNLGENQTFYAVVKQTTNEGIMNQDDAGSNRFWQFRYNGATHARLLGFSKAGANATDTQTNTITAGAWCVISGIRKTNTVECWLNGTSDGSTALSGPPASGSVRLRIGTATSTTDNPLTGFIGELRVYTIAHDATTHQTIRQALGTKWGVAGVA